MKRDMGENQLEKRRLGRMMSEVQLFPRWQEVQTLKKGHAK